MEFRANNPRKPVLSVNRIDLTTEEFKSGDFQVTKLSYPPFMGFKFNNIGILTKLGFTDHHIIAAKSVWCSNSPDTDVKCSWVLTNRKLDLTSKYWLMDSYAGAQFNKQTIEIEFADGSVWFLTSMIQS